jgi:AhpD family alkylhydroperoxidase
MEVKRINVFSEYPEAYKALSAVETYFKNSNLTGIQKDLIRMRASQLNKCAFCLDKHSKDARKQGETEQRLYVLDAWREAPFYTPEERALLAMTEEVTLIGQQGLTEATYQEVLKYFGADGLVNILMGIAAINTWNRLAIAMHYVPEY